MNHLKVGINEFVKRQTIASRFSHYVGTFEELAQLAETYVNKWDTTSRKGYRDGVWEVDVPPAGFYSAVVQLKEGDKLVGCYEARRQGEIPRRHIGVLHGDKLPAKAVTLILYSHDVLAENNEQSTECPLELISINARPTIEPEPINPGTLMANHFKEDGGTDTKMTDSEFVQALKISTSYWKDKAMIEVEKSAQ